MGVTMNQPAEKDWTALYEAAIAFRQASPWEWMANEDLFAIVNPSNSEPGYCSVLGNGGQEFGLGIFVGEKGLSGYVRMMSDTVEPDRDDSRMVPLLSMLFVNRNELHSKDRDVVRSLGLSFRGKNAWPLFRSQTPGYLPWYLEKDEALFLTAAVQQTLAVAGKVREGKLDLLMKGDDFVFTRRLAGGTWKGEWRRLVLPDSSAHPQAEPLGAVDEARLLLLGKLASGRRGSWEFDIFQLPAPVGSGSDRPYFPLCFLVVESEQDLILDTDVTEPWLSLAEKHDRVLRILEKAQQLPREVRVRSESVRHLLEPIAGSLGIQVKVGRLPMLEEARAGLAGFLSRGRA